MSSSTTDPTGRPMSQNSASSTSGAPFKTFGQDYQYAETLQNPFPEVIFSGPANATHSAASTSPAAVSGIDGTNESPADHDTRSSLRLGTPGSKEPAMSENVWVEPAEVPWYKTISKGRWAAIIICTVGITGVVLAILGAMNKLSGERSDTSKPSPDSPTLGNMSTDEASSSNTPSPAESTSATPTTFVTSTTSGNAKPTVSKLFPPQTMLPIAHLLNHHTNPHPPPGTQNTPTTKIDCGDLSSFLTPISWIGTTVGAYTTEFAPTGHDPAAACCRACLERADGGCAGWLHNTNSQFTPCTLVVIDKDQADRGGDRATCPRGRAETTFFNAGVAGDGSSGTAGMGPCALGGHVN